MKTIKIFGLSAEKVQDKNLLQYTFTKYGNCIRTRLGLNHEDGVKNIILLEVVGDPAEVENFQNALRKIEGLEFQVMTF